MGYCEQDLASLLENMQVPFSEAQVGTGWMAAAPVGGRGKEQQPVLLLGETGLARMKGPAREDILGF